MIRFLFHFGFLQLFLPFLFDISSSISSVNERNLANLFSWNVEFCFVFCFLVPVLESKFSQIS